MEKIRNLSIKKSIVLYMVISLSSSFLLSAIIVREADITQRYIWLKYIDKEKYYQAATKEDPNYNVSVSRVSNMNMSKLDGNISEICDFLQTYSILVLSITGSWIAVALFYRNKLKKPVEELDKASKRIAQNDLDFHVTYHNKDELGQLCYEFEKMRLQLVENNRATWNMVEEEKALRAAIAHDIRSPLTILKGYQEMMLDYVPEDTFSKQKIIDMLNEGMRQIERMDRFIEMMRKMTSLSERELNISSTNLQTLGKQIQEEASMLSKDMGKNCMIKVTYQKIRVMIDEEIVLEVVENLLNNALRYAQNEILLDISLEDKNVVISVMDDGHGFKESPEIVTKAFYHSNPQDNLQHFGMGMYISKIYCEKHDGMLLLGSSDCGGAKVKAVFKSYI